MTAERHPDIETILTAWFEADAQPGDADAVLRATLSGTSRVRPLPAWRVLERWIPMQLTMRRQPLPRLAPFLLVLALLLIAVLAIGVIGSRPKLPAPFGVAVNGEMAFVTDGSLVIQQPDGSRTVVAGGPSGRVSPQFSSDGTRIVYKERLTATIDVPGEGPTPAFDVVVARADGTQPRVLAHQVLAGNPVWSPDGRWIVFSTVGDHMFVVPSDGSTPAVDIGDLDGHQPWTPAFSPDSQHLAVSATGDDGHGQLWVLDRDGSGGHPISQGIYAEVGSKGQSATWSPDGTQLLFTAADLDGTSSLYLVGLEGKPEALVAKGGANGVWSPDGSMIAWTQHGENGNARIEIADRALRSTRVLKGNFGWYMPAWSPDQSRIAILDDKPGPNDVFGPPVIAILDPNGIMPTVTIPAGNEKLTEDVSPDWTLTWQRLALP